MREKGGCINRVKSNGKRICRVTAENKKVGSWASSDGCESEGRKTQGEDSWKRESKQRKSGENLRETSKLRTGGGGSLNESAISAAKVPERVFGNPHAYLGRFQGQSNTLTLSGKDFPLFVRISTCFHKRWSHRMSFSWWLLLVQALADSRILSYCPFAKLWFRRKGMINNKSLDLIVATRWTHGFEVYIQSLHMWIGKPR